MHAALRNEATVRRRRLRILAGVSTPELSVVVLVGSLRDRAGPCLRALLDQGLGERLEVVLVDFTPAGGPIDGADEAVVRRVAAPAGATFASARAEAVRRWVRSPVVAFVEEHVRVHPGWAEALLAAHRGPWDGVGSVAETANPGVGRSDLLGLLTYGYFMAPQRRREVPFLPGHNASFKTAALRRYGDQLDRLLICDLLLHQRMCRDGSRLLLEPASRFAHLNESHARVLARGLFLWNRCYGSLRARELGWRPLRRLAYLLGWPLVPVWGLLLMVRRHRRRRGEVATLLRGLPALVALLLTGACGQAWGLLAGAGDAEARFTRYELSAPRPTRAAAG